MAAVVLWDLHWWWLSYHTARFALLVASTHQKELVRESERKLAPPCHQISGELLAAVVCGRWWQQTRATSGMQTGLLLPAFCSLKPSRNPLPKHQRFCCHRRASVVGLLRFVDASLDSIIILRLDHIWKLSESSHNFTQDTTYPYVAIEAASILNTVTVNISSSNIIDFNRTTRSNNE